MNTILKNMQRIMLPAILICVSSTWTYAVDTARSDSAGEPATPGQYDAGADAATHSAAHMSPSRSAPSANPGQYQETADDDADEAVDDHGEFAETPRRSNQAGNPGFQVTEPELPLQDRHATVDIMKGESAIKAQVSDRRVIDRDWLVSRLHQPKEAFRQFKSDDYHKSQLYVQLDPATDADFAEAILLSNAKRIMWKSRAIPGLYRVEVAEDEEVLAADAFLNREEVIYAEPDYRVYSTTNPNDPRWDDLWNMKGNVGCRAQWAWDEFTGSSSQVIAVIDNGFQLTHDDLEDNLWTNPGEIDGNGIDDDGNGVVDDIHGYDVADNDGDPHINSAWCGDHGTHVAGIVGGRGNNSIGVAGVNWRASLMLIKCGFDSDFDDPNDPDDSCGLYFTSEGVEYAYMNGARVSNNSYGGYSYSQTQKDIIEAGQDYGHLFVCAAGNDGWNIDASGQAVYPAGYNSDNIVTVANGRENGTMSGSSNFGGTSVDLGAPGDQILSCVTGNGYGYKNGTSMASPHVAGAAGLILADQPTIDWFDLKWRILNAVIYDDDFNSTVTGGVLNVHKALGIWVEKGAGGDELGTRFQPKLNFQDGLDAVRHRGVLKLAPDAYGWTGTLDQYVRVVSPEGASTIGQ